MSDLKPVSPLNGASTKGFATVREIGPLGAVSNRLQNVSSIQLAPTLFWNFWEWKLS